MVSRTICRRHTHICLLSVFISFRTRQRHLMPIIETHLMCTFDFDLWRFDFNTYWLRHVWYGWVLLKIDLLHTSTHASNVSVFRTVGSTTHRRNERIDFELLWMDSGRSASDCIGEKCSKTFIAKIIIENGTRWAHQGNFHIVEKWGDSEMLIWINTKGFILLFVSDNIGSLGGFGMVWICCRTQWAADILKRIQKYLEIKRTLLFLTHNRSCLYKWRFFASSSLSSPLSRIFWVAVTLNEFFSI